MEDSGSFSWMGVNQRQTGTCTPEGCDFLSWQESLTIKHRLPFAYRGSLEHRDCPMCRFDTSLISKFGRPLEQSYKFERWSGVSASTRLVPYHKELLRLQLQQAIVLVALCVCNAQWAS